MSDDADVNGILEVVDVTSEGLSSLPAPIRKSLYGAFNDLVQSGVSYVREIVDGSTKKNKNKNEMDVDFERKMNDLMTKKIDVNDDLMIRAMYQKFSNDVKSQKNREAVFGYCAKYLIENGQNSKANIENCGDNKEGNNLVDPYWMKKFYTLASDAQSEEIRIRFGKILSGEIISPGSFSLFTIDIMSKIGKFEAEVIMNLASYVIGRNIIITDLSKSVVNYGNSATLIAIGILNPTSVGPVGANIEVKLQQLRHGENIYTDSIFGHRYGLIFESLVRKNIKLKTATLTRMGEEVIKIIDREPNKDFILEIARMLRKDGVDLRLGKVEKIVGDTIQYSEAELIMVD